MRKIAGLIVIAFIAFFVANVARAAEIRILTPDILQTVIDKIAPDFEKASGHKLKVTYGIAAPLKRQIENGDTFDVAILVPAMIDDLIDKGKIASGTKAVVVKTGVGLAIKRGAPKPEIGSAAALKKALLDAKSIAYSKEGQSGAVAVAVFERLGISAEMTPKTILALRAGAEVSDVAEGKAELALSLMGLILRTSDVELAGPLPGDLQKYVVFAAAVSSASTNADAARALVDYFQTPAVLSVLKANGMM